MNLFKILELKAGDISYYWTYNKRARYYAEKQFGARVKVFIDDTHTDPTYEEELCIIFGGIKEGQHQKGLPFTLTFEQLLDLDNDYNFMSQVSDGAELEDSKKKS